MFNNNTDTQVREKLTLLMLIHAIEKPLTNEEITATVLDGSLTDFISMQHYLKELCELSMLEQLANENKTYYLLTENGRVALDFFKGRIPLHVQDKILKIADNFKAKLPVETQVKSNYTKVGDEDYQVTLEISENHKPMMSLSLNVMSHKHAEQICVNWEEQATHTFGEILTLLTKTEHK